MFDDGWGNGDAQGVEDGDKKRSSGCHRCGEEGHFAKECPNKPADSGCRRCGEEGHFAKECPNKPADSGCRRCGEEGHFAKECPKEEETRVVTKEDGTTHEIYVPQEMAEDDLYGNAIASGTNFDHYDQIPVESTGGEAFEPLQTFEASNLRRLLLENVERSGYKKPTPVQKYAIPSVLAGNDLMASAQTGSGKTAAFLLPICHALLAENADPGFGMATQTPGAVVVAPTRELAVQIHNEARKFLARANIKSVVLYGGTSTQAQMSSLSKGCNILVATTGRLKDFLQRGKLSLENVKFLVLDEADRMLDMGFGPDINEIISHTSMPPKEQRKTLMFSATLEKSIQDMAKDFMRPNYNFITVGRASGDVPDEVEQIVLEVQRFKKRDKLCEILDEMVGKKVIVFTSTKKMTDVLATSLIQKGYPSTCIHGDRLQREREMALGDFRSGKFPVLVATSVASRGIDIQGVDAVVNFDLPDTLEDYVHRIGRTGRVGNYGKAYSFFDVEKDTAMAAPLVAKLSASKQNVPDFLQELAGNAGGAGGGQEGNVFAGRDSREAENDWE